MFHSDQVSDTRQQQPLYSHYTRQPVLARIRSPELVHFVGAIFYLQQLAHLD